MKSKFLGLAIAAAGCMAALPAYASLTADGLTYTLTAFKTADPNIDNFTLSIAGINGPSDTEGGRYGVFALAFNQPTGFASATPPSGFGFQLGGLSSGTGAGGGCDSTGNFFCFENTQAIDQGSLAPDSSLSFSFSVDATGISTWGIDTVNNPDGFKISWDGAKSTGYGTTSFKSGYDHVSENLPPTAAPEMDPGSAAAALTLLAGGLALLRGRRRRV